MKRSTFKVACVQNCADDDLQGNIADCLELARGACEDGARLVCLPEYFCCIERDAGLVVEHALAEAAHPAVGEFSALAREYGVWVLIGSIPVRAASRKVNNRSLLIDSTGKIVARYNKIHLFDVELKSGESYRESATVLPGSEAVVAATPWGQLGLSVCYDIRFPYLYRTLAHQGARFLSVPAVFTRTTGRAHWHTLVRARAIETACFVFAPAQCGVRSWGRAAYGHSLIVDPWGEVLADAGEERGVVSATIDVSKVAEARRMVPALHHDRPIRAATTEGAGQPARISGVKSRFSL